MGYFTDEIKFTMEIVKKLQQEGISTLIIENNVKILDICEHVVTDRRHALRVGKIVLEGNIENFTTSGIIKEGYLGK